VDGTEPVLDYIVASFDRVVSSAYLSLCEDKVNVFDTARINSFIRQQHASDRPLFFKLQKTTYRQYCAVWKRLLCFAYRSTLGDQSCVLSHRLSRSQMFALESLTACAEHFHPSGAPAEQEGSQEMQIRLDQACLTFCIALLDHELRGDLYESVVVGFFAALAINERKGTLEEAITYTPHLSGFIKISQLLVIQKAIVDVEEGMVRYASDSLDAMRDRFLLHGSRSPFNWALRLRAYGKKIRDSTTSHGYISWSEDSLTLTYRGFEVSLSMLQEIVRCYIKRAQTQLEELLLIHHDEEREDVVPAFSLRYIHDNPANTTKAWNFLKDERNHEQLPTGEKFLLNRVLSKDWLREEFLAASRSEGHVTWQIKAAQRYLAQVDQFLESMLLLIHVTAGQPARGSEILGLRVLNSREGQHHRSIFVEEGLVSTVTAYHKGYNIEGSTKIIHRYLPKEVGELLVIYLWAVRPFRQQLELLALQKEGRQSPFLWALSATESWKATRLTAVLKKATESVIGSQLGTSVYRHMAIAFSRKHLPCGGFKRDYTVGEEGKDNQSAHGSWMAGTAYARGLHEAPGHVEARRAEYRMVSRQWHDLLGFENFLSYMHSRITGYTDDFW